MGRIIILPRVVKENSQVSTGVIYRKLNRERLNSATAKEAVRLAGELLAERATITGGGTILRWSEFNENPDPLVNELLARILVDKVEKKLFDAKTWENVLILSIENSAAYLAGALAYEVADVASFDRPVRIIRSRKVGAGSTTSPAMGEKQEHVVVSPITAGGETRQLVCSITDSHDFENVSLVLVVDDFRATGSTLEGGMRLATMMFPNSKVIGMAALGKPHQETVDEKSGTMPILTALDVHFWQDIEDQCVRLQISGGEPLVMARAQVW